MNKRTDNVGAMKNLSWNCFSRTVLNWALLLLVTPALIILSGCATTQSAQLPPITSNTYGKVDAGKFVWIDLVTENTQDAAIFYRGLFGWRVKPAPGDKTYLVISLDGEPIGGMTAAKKQDGKAPESWWLLTLSVADVDQSVAEVTQNGGKLLEGPIDDAGHGYVDDGYGDGLLIGQVASVDGLTAAA